MFAAIDMVPILNRRCTQFSEAVFRKLCEIVSMFAFPHTYSKAPYVKSYKYARD